MGKSRITSSIIIKRLLNSTWDNTLLNIIISWQLEMWHFSTDQLILVCRPRNYPLNMLWFTFKIIVSTTTFITVSDFAGTVSWTWSVVHAKLVDCFTYSCSGSDADLHDDHLSFDEIVRTDMKFSTFNTIVRNSTRCCPVKDANITVHLISTITCTPIHAEKYHVFCFGPITHYIEL